MNEPEEVEAVPDSQDENESQNGRDEAGRWLPGVTPRGAKPWQKGVSANPGGVPKTVVGHLRAILNGTEEPNEKVRAIMGNPETPEEVAQAIANVPLAVVLNPAEETTDRLAALKWIVDRGPDGPVAKEVRGHVDMVVREIVVVGTKAEAPALPPEVLAIEEARLAAEERAQVGRAGEGAKGD